MSVMAQSDSQAVFQLFRLPRVQPLAGVQSSSSVCLLAVPTRRKSGKKCHLGRGGPSFFWVVVFFSFFLFVCVVVVVVVVVVAAVEVYLH